MANKFAAMELPVDALHKMVIVHPVTRQPLRSSEGVEAYIEHYSSDSSVAQKHRRTVTRRRLDMRGRGKLSPEELDAENTDLLAALSTGWYLVSLDGTPIDVQFNQENARELYTNPGVAYIREQLDESAGDRGNFASASLAS